MNGICGQNGEQGHHLNVNATLPSPKSWMTRKGRTMWPRQPFVRRYCSDWVRAMLRYCRLPRDSPSLYHFFFFFYLLRCCSSSQNKSFIAISSWPCTRTPRALIVLPASGIINNPKSASSTSLSVSVFEGFWVPVTLLPSTSFARRSIYRTDLGRNTKDAVVGAAARMRGVGVGGGDQRQECRLVRSVSSSRESPPSMSPICAWMGG